MYDLITSLLKYLNLFSPCSIERPYYMSEHLYELLGSEQFGFVLVERVSPGEGGGQGAVLANDAKGATDAAGGLLRPAGQRAQLGQRGRRLKQRPC